MSKLDPSPDAEGGGDNKGGGFSYSAEMERLLCDRLAIDNEQSRKERQQRRRFGYLIVPVAGVVPLLALGVLYKIIMDCPEYFFSDMGASIPKAVLISAPFLSMVVIYAFLIKGMFQSAQKNDTNDVPSAVKEILRLLRSLGGKE